MQKQTLIDEYFNPAPVLPFNLRLEDVAAAMRDVYDFFYDVNTFLRDKSLPRFDDTVRPAVLSGMLSDMLTESVAKHSRSLVSNKFHNGHPDLLVAGVYPNDSTQSGKEGVEIKATQKPGGAVDTHGGRDQWMLVFVYKIDRVTEPATQRDPLRFTEVYLGNVKADDFRVNERGQLGTRTATLDREGVVKLRDGWLYMEPSSSRSRPRSLRVV